MRPDSVIISRPNSNALKALCCILIVLHHYFQSGHLMNIAILSPFFINICGYISVAVFFFLSGYGITESEQNRHLNIIGFVKKRLLRVYIPFVITNILFLITITLLGAKQYNLWDMVNYILGIRLIDSITWFVPVLLLFYCFSFICFYFNNKATKVISLIVFTALYAFLGFTILSIPFYAIVSVPAFSIGFICSVYKTELCQLLSIKHYSTTIYTSCAFICVACVLIMLGIFNVSKQILHFIIAINSISLVILIISTFADKDIQWFKCNWLGNISYEVYLTHAKVFIFWLLIFGTIIPFWAILIIIPIAYIINKLDSFALTFINKR